MVEGLARRPTVRASLSIGRTIPPPLFEAEQPKNLHQTKARVLKNYKNTFWQQKNQELPEFHITSLMSTARAKD